MDQYLDIGSAYIGIITQYYTFRQPEYTIKPETDTRLIEQICIVGFERSQNYE